MLPGIFSHSHSIINKALKPNNDGGLEIADSINTMKNTMIKKIEEKYCDILLNHQTRLKFCAMSATNNAPIEAISTATRLALPAHRKAKLIAIAAGLLYL